MKFNLPKIQAIIAPLTAPVPSAISIAVEAYIYVLAQSSSVVLGWFAAVSAFAGIETMGGASCYAVIKLHQEKRYGVEFYVSLLGIIVYIGSGVGVLWGSPTIIFFFLAPFSYFAYSIVFALQEEDTSKTNDAELQIKLKEADAKEKEIEVKRINAETKRIKAEKMESVVVEKVVMPEPAGTFSEAPEDLRKKILPRPNWMEFVPKVKSEFVGGVKDGRIRLPAGIKAPKLAQYVPVSVRSCQDWLNEIKNGEAFV